ncbi:MAG: hypothetical protein LBV42_02245 [Methanobrevibacter sp.]|nr:hypothetical protein [Methanobrevibacter sp.]
MQLKSIGIANQVLYPFNISLKEYRNLSNDEINNDLNEVMFDFEIYDGNDIILRNNALFSYNIEKILDKIIARTLIIAINQDQYFPPDLDAVPFFKMIKNSKFVIYDSKFGHHGDCEIYKIKNKIKMFLNPLNDMSS